jgi:steroid delta-isomerase-like uncharacterized protein
MSRDTKELVRSWFEAYSRHDIETAAKFLTEDVVMHNTTNQGREGLAAEAEYWFAAFPDASVSVEDLIAEDDRVVARVSATGTHQGEFMGTPPTGRQISVEEIDIFRIENGMIAEIWPAPDIVRMLMQIGALPGGEGEE